MDRSSYEGLDRPTTPPPSHVATGYSSGASSNINRAEVRAGPRQGELPRSLCGRSHDRCPTPDRDSPGRTNGNAVSNPRIRARSPTSSGPPSPLHDPSSNQLHAGERGERPSRACGASQRTRPSRAIYRPSHCKMWHFASQTLRCAILIRLASSSRPTFAVAGGIVAGSGNEQRRSICPRLVGGVDSKPDCSCGASVACACD